MTVLRPSDAAYTAAASRPARRRRCTRRTAAAGEVRRPSAPPGRGSRASGASSPSGTSTSGRSARPPGRVAQPPGLGVALDVVPAVGHVVAGQEHLEVVAAVRPPVPDHPHVGVWSGLACRQSPSRSSTTGYSRSSGVPRLEQVVVEADVVDRPDGHVGVGVRREQQELRPGAWARPGRAARCRSSAASAGRRRSGPRASSRRASYRRTTSASAPDVARTTR
jgi:hypothetical protein